MGYYFGFMPGDRRRIDVKLGEWSSRWWAYVDGITLKETYATKDEAEAAAIEVLKATPEVME
jgi:hypothetical protein